MRSSYSVDVDGTRLPVLLNDVADPRGIVVITHGYSEHSGRYAALAAAFAEAGLAVVRYDLRGHGRAPGRPGAGTVLRHVRDNLRVREAVGRHWRNKAGDARSGALPVVLVGHGVGAVVSVDSALRRPWNVAALVQSAPSYAPETALLRSARAIVSMAIPGLGVAPIRPEQVSRDPEEVLAYALDPLVVHSRIPAEVTASMITHGADVLRRAGYLRVPTMTVHGTDDAISSIRGSRRFVATAGTLVDRRPRVEYREIVGGFHAPFHDLGRDELVADTVAFASEAVDSFTRERSADR